MAINSKAKGNKFERDVSEKLSLWLTDNKEKRACWRSDSSGASATNWAKKGTELRYVKANAGDIRKIVEKGDYPKLDNFFDTYVVECKHYKKIDFYPPFDGTLTKFFKQAIAERAATSKRIALILKANNKKTLICLEGDDCFIGPKPAFKVFYEDIVLGVFQFEEVVAATYVTQSSGIGDTVDSKRKDSEL